MITLKINGRVVEVEEGSTILQAAKKQGIFVPTFCFDDFERMPAKHCSNCHEYGDCKICSCEVEGVDSLLTACNTPAEDGMIVWTESAEVKKARVSILNRMIATHPLDCVNCKKLGACKLQKYCEMYGVKEPQYVIPYEHREKDMSSRFYYHDMDKCIRCGKCVRTCRDLVGINALTMAQRGNVAYVIPNVGKTMAETACVSCGNCVSVCPVGAIMPKSQHDFREWETKKVQTTCTYCGVGCQIEYSVKDGMLVGARPADGPSNHGLLCVKGKFAYDFINHKDRLTHPMIRKNGRLVESSWDEALDLVAGKILEVKEEYGPDSIAGFSSARTDNESNYLFQKLLRAGVGTNNVDHCARL